MKIASRYEKPETIIIWNKDEPRAVINLVPPMMAERMAALYIQDEEIFTMTEAALFQRLCKSKSRPTASDNRLRLNFWLAYDECIMTNRDRITLEQICGNMCSLEFFTRNYLIEPNKLSWLLVPPVNYGMKMVEAVDSGLDQMRGILDLEHIDYETGKIDHKLLAIKVTIFKLLDDRTHGAAVQKIEKKQNIQISTSVRANQVGMVREMARTVSEDMLLGKLKELKNKERDIMGVAEENEKELEEAVIELDKE
jgi:hypothetical protein